jgi:hypothetical protein
LFEHDIYNFGSYIYISYIYSCFFCSGRNCLCVCVCVLRGWCGRRGASLPQIMNDPKQTTARAARLLRRFLGNGTSSPKRCGNNSLRRARAHKNARPPVVPAAPTQTCGLVGCRPYAPSYLLLLVRLHKRWGLLHAFSGPSNELIQLAHQIDLLHKSTSFMIILPAEAATCCNQQQCLAPSSSQLPAGRCWTTKAGPITATSARGGVSGAADGAGAALLGSN